MAYLRRLIEGEVDRLLELLKEQVSLAGDAGKLAALEAARGEIRASERLRLAEQALPKHLEVEGANPLARMYGAFSEELHAGTDEEAVQTANDVKTAFEYLFASLSDERRTRADYVASVRRIQTKP